MIKAIGQVQSDDRLQNQLQSNLQPFIRSLTENAILSGIILQQVDLVVGDNTVVHKLNKKLQGWYLVRVRASASIYDKQDDNPNPNKTLILNSSAAVTVDIAVF